MEEFATLFDDQQRLAGEQLQAAWQLHVDRVAETLETGWRENIVRVLEQRFASLKEEMSTANQLYLLTAVEARVCEQMDEKWRNGLQEATQEKEEKFEERVQQRLQQCLSEEFQNRVEAAVAERLDSDVVNRVQAEIESRVEGLVAERLEQLLEERVAERLSQELPHLIAEHTEARFLDQLPERVDAAVAQRLATELPQRLSETLALRLAEEVPARLAEEKANLIAWEKANWDAEFLPRLESAAAQAREQAIAETAEKTRDAARRELGLQLSQSLRLLSASNDAKEWKESFLDAVFPHAALAALFLVTQERFSLEGVRGMAGELETGFELEFQEAQAFYNAMESKDLVVALRSDAEVSPYVMSLRPDAHSTKCFIFPVTTGEQVAALLYVEPGEQPLEVGAIEILSTAAGLTLQSIRGACATQSSSLVNFASAVNPEGSASALQPEAVPAFAAVGAHANGSSAPAAIPERSFSWDQLSQEQREMHMRAQRFARVQVAEMRLYKDDAVKGGRRDANIYLRLKNEIDEARERYLSQFLDGQSHMRDYLHAELVETLAIDHPQLMGPDYPGPLAY